MSKVKTEEEIKAKAETEAEVPVSVEKVKVDYYKKLAKGRKLLELIKSGKLPQGWKKVTFTNGNTVKVPNRIAEIYKGKHFFKSIE